jgi:hypothetical protein
MNYALLFTKKGYSNYRRLFLGGVVEKKKVTTSAAVVTFFFAFLCGGVVATKAVSPSFLCLRRKRRR